MSKRYDMKDLGEQHPLEHRFGRRFAMPQVLKVERRSPFSGEFAEPFHGCALVLANTDSVLLVGPIFNVKSLFWLRRL
jgi:hypothetical protein